MKTDVDSLPMGRIDGDRYAGTRSSPAVSASAVDPHRQLRRQADAEAFLDDLEGLVERGLVYVYQGNAEDAAPHFSLTASGRADVDRRREGDR